MEKKETKYYTYKLNMTILNIMAIMLFVIVSGLVYLIECSDKYVINSNIIILFLLMFVWLIFHEILHGIGF